MVKKEFDINTIPEVNPYVDLLLMRCLRDEVFFYFLNIKGKRCHLCPFRLFSRTRGFIDHAKYHCEIYI